MTDQMKAPAVYECVVVSLPEGKSGTELALDADETYLYWETINRSERTVDRPQAPAEKSREAQARFREEMRNYFEVAGRGASEIHKINIMLISRTTGEQILLTTGHPMIPDHAHPIFSRDSKRVLIQSGILTAGKALNLMVVHVP